MLEPREYETPENKSPVIRAVSALLLTIFTFASLVRLLTRILALGVVKKDDVLIIASTAFALIQSVLVILQGANGFGQPMDNLSDGQVDGILKRQYAAEIFYLLALTLAKLSASRTTSDLAPGTRRWFIWGTEGLIGLWGLTSILLSCFQCSVSAPWDYINGQCLDRAALGTYIDAVNIITDVALTALLVELVKDLQVKAGRKIMVLGVFSSRLLNIPPIAAHIYYFRRAANSTDPTFDMWQPVILAQVIQCVSMVATCTPFLKPLMDALDSGGWVMGDLRNTQASASRSRSGNTAGATPLGYAGRSSRAKTDISAHRRREYEVLEAGKNGGVSSTQTSGKYNNNEGVTTATASSGNKPPSWDGVSQTSQTVLVHQTWAVERDEGTKAPHAI